MSCSLLHAEHPAAEPPCGRCPAGCRVGSMLDSLILLRVSRTWENAALVLTRSFALEF